MLNENIKKLWKAKGLLKETKQLQKFQYAKFIKL